MKSFIAAVGAVAVILCFILAGTAHYASTSLSPYEQAQKETAIVETATGFGSGVFVVQSGRVFLWTAEHVVHDTATVKVRTVLRNALHEKAGEIIFPAHVILRFPEADSALLLVDAPPEYVHPALWTREPLHVGQKVFAVGNFYGPDFDGSVSDGIISQLGRSPSIEGWPWAMSDQSTATITPGSSGGPIFTMDGSLAGLVVGGPRQGLDNVSCFIPERVIEAAARKAGESWAIFGPVPSSEYLSKLVLKEAKIIADEEAKIAALKEIASKLPAPGKKKK